LYVLIRYISILSWLDRKNITLDILKDIEGYCGTPPPKYQSTRHSPSISLQATAQVSVYKPQPQVSVYKPSQ